MALQAARIINYRVGNTGWEFYPCMFLKVKNVNKLNPSKLTRVSHLNTRTHSFREENRNCTET